TVPGASRSCHAAFLRGMQQSDGGFPGRAGASDVYYTSFALRGLLLLDALDADTARRAGEFLAQAARPTDAVELFTFLSSAMLAAMAGGADSFAAIGTEPVELVQNVLDPLACPDGGVGKSSRSGMGSTYHTFLGALCREMAGQPMENGDQIAAFVRGRQREDGGFVELPVMRRSGVNPTAAAVALLRMMDALDAPTSERAARYLMDAQGPDGGFRAHSAIPTADLLSTMTGLVALGDLRAWHHMELASVRRFVNSLALPGGGYLAATLDDQPDTEYAFYGIAASALLAA
ncbi:MAG: prenyltransferase/squalene oxidase repeat-containing protein, partial [Patescibacteria group bacterium]|nr:prenyltransferase/squalene oxidase repeat-containing protein [Patescibacteria group bacterium]